MNNFEKAIKAYLKKEQQIANAIINFADNILKSCITKDDLIYIDKKTYENIKTVSCVNVFREIDLNIKQSKRIDKFLKEFNIPNKKLHKNETVESVLKLYEYWLLEK